MRIWWGLLPLFLYYAVHNGVVLAGMELLESWQSGRELFSGEWLLYQQTFVKMLGIFLAGAAVFPFYRKERSKDALFSDKRKCKVIQMAKVLLAGGALGTGLNILFYVCGFTQSSEEYRQVAQSQFALPLWLAVIFYGMLSPIVEEMLFRGILYSYLKRNGGKIFAIIGSALLFGGMHGNVVQLVYGAIMGVVLALYYEKYGEITAPVLFHAGANIAVYFLTCF